MNIIDIAKLAGVSKSTVSRFLNNGYVSEVNREKIQKVIAETGYRPSTHAKTLRTKKTNLIGVILPKISSETISKIVSGISNELSKHSYNMILGNTDLNINKEIEYLQIFKDKNVDGIIFVATVITKKHLEILDDIKIPIVMVGQNIKGYPCVYHSDYEASYEMVNYLIENNHKNIAYIGVHREDISVGLNRERGYTDCLIDNNIKVDKNKIKIGEFTQESGQINTKKLLENNNDIDAIFCATANIAIGSMQYLNDNKINIPREISVCAIGTSKVSNIISPKLTTVEYYYEESGIQSAKMIMNALNDYSDIQSRKLGYDIKYRESISVK